MDNWILKGPRTLIKEELKETKVQPGQIKVKITHALITDFETQLFGGTMSADYPKTLGRFAVGMVTEGEEQFARYNPEKAKVKVYLEPLRGCAGCLECKRGRPDLCENTKIAGRNFDGFYRDFVVCDPVNVTMLPPGLDEADAVCTEYVAMAEKVISRLSMDPGDKVAVFGGGILGTIIAQVAQYHKFVPIVIDNDLANLEIAKRCGIFHCQISDDNLYRHISEITVGRNCDGAVYVMGSKLNAQNAARVVSKQKCIVYAGFAYQNFSLDMREIIEKSLHVFTVTDGFGYTGAAMNLIANKALDLGVYGREIITDVDLQEYLDERVEAGNTPHKLTIYKMIM